MIRFPFAASTLYNAVYMSLVVIAVTYLIVEVWLCCVLIRGATEVSPNSTLSFLLHFKKAQEMNLQNFKFIFIQNHEKRRWHSAKLIITKLPSFLHWRTLNKKLFSLFHFMQRSLAHCKQWFWWRVALMLLTATVAGVELAVHLQTTFTLLIFIPLNIFRMSLLALVLQLIRQYQREKLSSYFS